MTFVGRARDLERLRELLSASRVVTLLGPGGIGKTRLATHVAAELGDRALFVPLAEARSGSAVASAVATALGDSTGDIGHALASRGDVVVVLDNVEQITEPTAELVGMWIRAAPAATFLVTSRERLRIEAEACFEVQPLEQDEAVRLFIARATLATGRFAPDEGESRAIAELVDRLDKNPLAIELAAARTKLFSAREMLTRTDKRFDLLTGGPRDRTARQTSLRGAIDWSWQLLGDAERTALVRCAVFRGGFTVEAAEAVVGDLRVLESLVDKSLVHRDERGSRFSLYETIRDYAAERLAELGGDAGERHAQLYSALARRLAPALRGAKAIEASTQLRVETDNVLAAHAYLRTRDRRAAATTALDLNALLALRGPVEMQAGLLEAAVDDASEEPALLARALVARARAHLVRGETAAAEADADRALERSSGTVRALALETRARIDLERGRTDRALSSVEEAMAIYVKDGDASGEASALTLLAAIHIKKSRIDAARDILERAITLQKRRGDLVATMSLLANIGIVHHWQDRDDEAKRCYQAALELALALGDKREESVDRINLALLLVDEGALDEARAEFERALAIQRAAGHRQYVGNTVGSLGSLDLVTGNTKGARRRFEEALVIFRDLGHRRYEAATHRYLGTVFLEEGDLDAALHALETARAIADEVGDLKSFVLGPLGATLALLGRAREAEATFATARATLATRGEPRAFVLLEIFEAFLRVAEGNVEAARAALARTDSHRLAADARVARRLLASAIARRARTVPQVTLGEDARWFSVGPEGARVDLSKRRAPRLILRRLVEQHRAHPGLGVSLDDVIAAGWPGERIQAEAAAARAYTAIKTLRELGLGELLQRRDDGYLLDPTAKLA